MTEENDDSITGDASRLIDTIEQAEGSAIDAVRSFVEAVDGAFPDVGEDGPRRRIIDSAFNMVEELVGASNQLAQDIVKTAGDALEESEGSSTE